MSLLEITGLCKSFGGLEAVRGVDLAIEEGQIVGLIGPNGSGKTTVFNLITGLLRATAGRIVMNGRRNLLGLKPHAITALGVARTFQNQRLFNGMTVLENVLVGRCLHARASLPAILCGLREARREKDRLAGEAEELLCMFGDRLLPQAGSLASSLPYANRRRLEIARALATGPQLLLLDEPAAGMNPTESHELMADIQRVRNRGVSILLIEHDMTLIGQVCDHVVALDYGAKIAEGDCASVLRHPQVIEAYLGRGAASA